MSGSINRLGIENTQKITDSRAASFKQKPPKFQYSALLFFEYSSYFEEGNIVITYSKQGYAFKNWVEGLSDEAYYPWESPKKSTKIGQPYVCHQTK